ncbi:assimilatory sulfite reductase (NADPH) flavoprotein subunit [Sediminicurvatus halobius]|uniref:Sulfite reductase [NADPH] flavoprotein alpha-component n=1 Tax=Sediminicurvatus halobius TaxID=2182432 RepID=A0A2U2MW44_9GAMM|nr:assimilatory sulfite reductase (NADPH) flavoprotein subunit [Spiribacter halobius]PWG61064.1 assimilatory sulfite reductase (NADPH) flavoprotein subunit [Spiribacter halobius]UEX76767.1 assimilatory sulfite reductase (NADPH) flavoprotein subunit [Spiribacter halobius]
MASNALDQVNSPLSSEQAEQVNRLVGSLAPEQLSWVSGYLAGLQGQPLAGSGGQPQAATARQRLTILYGSETGNAEGLARHAGELAAARGLDVRVQDMADYKPKSLRDERLLLIITATHGEGDPPDTAADFHEFLHGRKAPKLPETKFAVLALGDSSYEHFCQTGRDFDARLEALGAERLTERVDCDVDYEETAEAWLARALDGFAEHAETTGTPNNVVAFSGSGGQRATSRYDRKNPFPAEVLDRVLLNGRGSPKETHHIELSLEGSGIDYQPGDILGVVPENRDAIVGELLEALSLSGEETVSAPSGEVSLAEALKRDYEITTLTPAFVGAWADLAGADTLRALTAEERRRELMDWLEGRHVIDVVSEYPVAGLDAATLLGMLRRLQPREYSIASSHAASPGEVHLTVAAVRYESHGRAREGVASTYLADIAEPGATVPVYVRPNKHFRLPDSAETPIIMIGPGTGVAPFRAFLQEREEQGIDGGSWLFFGNPHHRTDFLYQTEWQRWLKDGVLERMDVAFSRDGAEKVYVQDRLRERGAEVWRWLEAGAHVYVCGDAERMAPDVHQALQAIARDHGGLDDEAAHDYLRELQRGKRYQRDVY